MLRIADENWKPEKKPTKTAEKVRLMNVARHFLKLADTLGDTIAKDEILAYWPDLKNE